MSFCLPKIKLSLFSPDMLPLGDIIRSVFLFGFVNVKSAEENDSAAFMVCWLSINR